MEPILARFVCSSHHRACPLHTFGPWIGGKSGKPDFSMSLNGLIEHSGAGFSRGRTYNQNDGVVIVEVVVVVVDGNDLLCFYDLGHISDR